MRRTSAISLAIIIFVVCTGVLAVCDAASSLPASKQDPIIGVWRYSDSSGFDFRYQFKADGTFASSAYDPGTGGIKTLKGTWRALGRNSYSLSSPSEVSTFIYLPAEKAIYDTRYPSILHISYTGNVMAASTLKLSTPTPTVVRTQDPIIGVWRYSITGYDVRYRFNVDGTYASSIFISDEEGTIASTGTWKAQGSNTYKLSDTTTSTIKYNSAQNSIYDTRYPSILLTPYQGDVDSNSYKPLPDPIIGVWQNSDSNSFDNRIRFNADGTVTSSEYDPETLDALVLSSGTWKAQGSNSYIAKQVGYDPQTFIYSPIQNAIYVKNDPTGLYYPYQGDVMTTSSPKSTQTYSSHSSSSPNTLKLSGNGDDVRSIDTVGTGLRIFTINYTGNSNFVIVLKNTDGQPLDTLVNKIGPYSGKISRSLTTNTYYLDVTAEGPWTIDILST